MNLNLQNYVVKYKPLIDREIAGELERRLEEVREISPHLVKIVEAMKELSIGGKRLRALLVILGYEIVGGVINDEIFKVATVMELFHLGLLCQDDVSDRDGLRRGVQTIHTRYPDLHLGESIAFYAGDYTFGWGMEIISGLDLPANELNKAIGVWGKYFTRVGYGQTLDCMAMADEKTLFQILALKSGEYSCVLPLIMGATLGGADKKSLGMLEKYGMELGWVFQLRDDWLGEYGDIEKTGKPVGSDSREGKKTLATMYGRAKLEQEIERHLMMGKDVLRGSTSKYGEMMGGLLEWMAEREN